ncbi:hypothetical protein LARV_00999 [Longilinea arvoryzae]|uniref:C2H2-type domain-containing protein n=1 Tax=Longilinea arvoryzae TaxID=360412 RepID=A0A0S7BEA5_9CHLR|nr:hypothetical protein [Longilinea arvoryzae]GAP13248.1 hypothetical protein LARV_00999 [Longilinea arvoryzae]
MQKRRGISDHTTTCPYCGHRCLHANLDDHIKRIHPDMVNLEAYVEQLPRTRPQQWWDQHKPYLEPDLVFDNGMPPVEVDAEKEYQKKVQANKKPVKPPKKASKKNQTNCPECGEIIYSSRLEAHLYKFHGLKKDPNTQKLVIVPIVNENGQIVPRFIQCDACGFWIAEDKLPNHKQAHQFFAPLVNWSDVLCPACGLLLAITQLSAHMRAKHPLFPKNDLKDAFKSYYGPERTRFPDHPLGNDDKTSH